MSLPNIQLPGIDRLGKCVCKDWVLLNEGENFLPKHNGPNGKECSNLGYSPRDFKYFITTRDKAVVVANFIQDDNDKCLLGRERHSMSCRDGDDCEETRLFIAKALAEYILT